MRLSRRAKLTRLARLATAAVTASVMVFATADAIAAPAPGGTPPTGEKPAVVYRALALPDGKTATVYSNGMAEIRDLAKGLVEDRMLPMTDLTPGPTGPALTAPKSQVIFDLVRGTPTPYAPGRVEVVLAPTVTGTTSLSVSRATLGKLGRLHGAALAEAAPRYSSSSALNVRLVQLGATKMSRLLGSVSASALARAKAAGSGTSPLDLTRAYVVDVAGAPVPQAVSALLGSPDVAYASPDWTVSTMNTQPRPLTKPAQQKAIRPLATPQRRPAGAADQLRAQRVDAVVAEPSRSELDPGVRHPAGALPRAAGQGRDHHQRLARRPDRCQPARRRCVQRRDADQRPDHGGARWAALPRSAVAAAHPDLRGGRVAAAWTARRRRAGRTRSTPRSTSTSR